MYQLVLRRYRVYLSHEAFRRRILVSIGFFILSIVVAFYAIGYTNTHASSGVTDIILSNIPLFEVDGFFVYGTFFLIFFVTALCVQHPKRAPFTLNALGLFWIIRSIFTTLTHIGPFASQTPFDLSVNLGTVTSRFFIGKDYFFSGHVGVPFLLSLIFWQEPPLRYLFLAWSGYFAVVVLLGHLHYSIDVFAAFFITYSIYHIALWFFAEDHLIFSSDL